jgi:hypothetical protein
MQQEKPSQSQSITGSSVSNTQLGQAGANLYQSQINSSAPPETQITAVQVVERLGDIKDLLLEDKNLPQPQKETAIKFLDAAKEEAKQKEPDKEMVAKNLKRTTEIIKTAGETVEASKGLWKNVQQIITPLIGWFSVAKNFFGF